VVAQALGFRGQLRVVRILAIVVAAVAAPGVIARPVLLGLRSVVLLALFLSSRAGGGRALAGEQVGRGGAGAWAAGPLPRRFLALEQGIFLEKRSISWFSSRVESCRSRMDCCSCGVSVRCCESLSCNECFMPVTTTVRADEPDWGGLAGRLARA
jgi:hypothetical protein